MTGLFMHGTRNIHTKSAVFICGSSLVKEIIGVLR
jgi:hypothetical protein